MPQTVFVSDFTWGLICMQPTSISTTLVWWCLQAIKICCALNNVYIDPSLLLHIQSWCGFTAGMWNKKKAAVVFLLQFFFTLLCLLKSTASFELMNVFPTFHSRHVWKPLPKWNACNRSKQEKTRMDFWLWERNIVSVRFFVVFLCLLRTQYINIFHVYYYHYPSPPNAWEMGD